MAAPEVIRDCNTCKFHTQCGQAPPPVKTAMDYYMRWAQRQIGCTECLALPGLPAWEQDEAIAAESKG